MLKKHKEYSQVVAASMFASYVLDQALKDVHIVEKKIPYKDYMEKIKKEMENKKDEDTQ